MNYLNNFETMSVKTLIILLKSVLLENNDSNILELIHNDLIKNLPLFSAAILYILNIFHYFGIFTVLKYVYFTKNHINITALFHS